MIEIAIIDDEKILVNSFRLSLEHWGYKVSTFLEAAPFLEYIKSNQPDVVFLDIQLPDINGMDVLKEITSTIHSMPTIMITAHGNMKSAIEAMKLGAFDYINKPFDLDEISLLIKKALEEVKLVREVEHHRERAYKGTSLNNIIGSSQILEELIESAKRVASIPDTTVMLRGESGTGKDLFAKAIHNLSNRSEKQFIEINCASFPENLLESELFGYEKGAFTDAKQRKIGLIELADEGTLFLDEVAELPPYLQAKLLKFIETRSFRRIGGTAEITVNVRIISATNRDLEQAIENKEFRNDLFYRLNVFPLTVPPLRERGRDIIELTNFYVRFFAKKFGKEDISLTDETIKAFMNYQWPGNVRELKNLCERLVIMVPENIIQYEQIPAEMRKRINDPKQLSKINKLGDMPLGKIMDQVETDLIQEALLQALGKKQKASEILQINRHSLLRRMKRLNI